MRLRRIRWSVVVCLVRAPGRQQNPREYSRVKFLTWKTLHVAWWESWKQLTSSA